MTSRELPRAEWAKLAETPIAAVLESLPENTRIVVVEDAAGTVVATWALIQYVHVEGVWVDQAHRKHGVVAGRLLREMRRVATDWGASVVLTGAIDDEVRGLIASLGGSALPGEAYVLPVEGPRCR